MIKYPSRYSNNKLVSAAQYITELICEKKAKYDKKDLGFKFWLNKEWSKFYRNQIATANKLVKKYPEQAIIKALNNSKSNNIFSLRAPHLVSIIEYEKKLLESQNKQISKDFDRSDKKTFIKQNKTNSVISKLKEIE